jgi:hypothetical protein
MRVLVGDLTRYKYWPPAPGYSSQIPALLEKVAPRRHAFLHPTKRYVQPPHDHHLLHDTICPSVWAGAPRYLLPIQRYHVLLQVPSFCFFHVLFTQVLHVESSAKMVSNLYHDCSLQNSQILSKCLQSPSNTLDNQGRTLGYLCLSERTSGEAKI